MASQDRLEVVRNVYTAFAAGDREVIERAFADDFVFSSPVDVDLDRAGYFERCWPGAGQGQVFEFVRQVESGDEVIVTYEGTRRGGETGRNTEIMTFDGEQICRVEVSRAADDENLCIFAGPADSDTSMPAGVR